MELQFEYKMLDKIFLEGIQNVNKRTQKIIVDRALFFLKCPPVAFLVASIVIGRIVLQPVRNLK